jgi:TldD protein
MQYGIDRLNAKSTITDKYNVFIGNELTGYIAHETFGHLAESDEIITGSSLLKNLQGKRFASDKVNIVDQGVIYSKNYPGVYLPYDDEGVKTKKTIIVENGILKKKLHNRQTAKYFKEELTGNARAINYKYPPICRMSNTFFSPGELKKEEGMELVKNGIYAKSATGGCMSLDGTFILKVDKAYIIKNGEIEHPLKNIIITGNTKDFLNKIIGVCDDFTVLSSCFGGCGKAGQGPLPVGNGGPHLICKNIMIGGEK